MGPFLRLGQPGESGKDLKHIHRPEDVTSIKVGRVVRIFFIKFSFDSSKDIRLKTKSNHERSGSLNPKECALVVASEVSVQT